MRTYKINENKTANVIGNVGIFLFLGTILIGIIIPILSIFFDSIDPVLGLGVFIGSLPIICIILLISRGFSTIDKDTKLYLFQINRRIGEAKTLEDYWNINNEFVREVIDENKMIRVSYPNQIRDILKELKYKIEILEKMKNNSK